MGAVLRSRPACTLLIFTNLADNCRIPHSATTMPHPTPCPCGGPSLDTCCGPYLAGRAVPQTAEQLMRSRYTAYTQGNEAYLRATWEPRTLPAEPLVDPNEDRKSVV